MRRFIRQSIAALSLGTFMCTSYAHPCSGSPSTFEESNCLVKEYKAIDSLLKHKVSDLMKMAEPVDMSNASAESIVAMRRQIQEAIRRADQLWRQSLPPECDVLVQASFGIGNGGELASLACRIERTEERIKFLSASEPYKWLWRK